MDPTAFKGLPPNQAERLWLYFDDLMENQGYTTGEAMDASLQWGKLQGIVPPHVKPQFPYDMKPPEPPQPPGGQTRQAAQSFAPSQAGRMPVPTPAPRSPVPVPTQRPTGPMDPEVIARSGIPTPTPAPRPDIDPNMVARSGIPTPSPAPRPNIDPNMTARSGMPVPSPTPRPLSNLEVAKGPRAPMSLMRFDIAKSGNPAEEALTAYLNSPGAKEERQRAARLQVAQLVSQGGPTNIPTPTPRPEIESAKTVSAINGRPVPVPTPRPSQIATTTLQPETNTAAASAQPQSSTPSRPQLSEAVRQRRDDLLAFERGEKLRPGAQFGNQALAEALMRRNLVGGMHR